LNIETCAALTTYYYERQRLTQNFAGLFGFGTILQLLFFSTSPSRKATLALNH
jgi:hypothetical protein